MLTPVSNTNPSHINTTSSDMSNKTSAKSTEHEELSSHIGMPVSSIKNIKIIPKNLSDILQGEVNEISDKLKEYMRDNELEQLSIIHTNEQNNISSVYTFYAPKGQTECITVDADQAPLDAVFEKGMSHVHEYFNLNTVDEQRGFFVKFRENALFSRNTHSSYVGFSIPPNVNDQSNSVVAAALAPQHSNVINDSQN